MKTQTQTVLELYQQFSQSEACKANSRLMDNLRTALRRYVLPRCGRFTSQELKKNLEGCLAQVPLDELIGEANSWLAELDKKIESPNEKRISTATATTYRSVLLRFLNWATYSQSWEQERKTVVVPDYAPAMHGGRSLATTLLEKKPELLPYSLREEELTPKLQEQLAQLQTFLGKPSLEERRNLLVTRDTALAYRESILGMLGWRKNIQQVDLSFLDLEQVTDVQQLEAFIAWGIKERGNSSGWATNITTAALAVAKWLSAQGQKTTTETRIRVLQRSLQAKYSSEKLSRVTVDKSFQQSEGLTYEKGEQIVDYLKECCASHNKAGVSRSETAIIQSWQRYLITALLVYTPIRQREIRALHLGNLIRDDDGYRLRFSDIDITKRKSAQDRAFYIPAHLTEDLDYWLRTMRPQIETEHHHVFIRIGTSRQPENRGQPLTDRDISNLITNAVSRAASILFDSPRRITPHMLRHAHAGMFGRFDISLRDLAFGIGHSVEDLVMKPVQQPDN